MHVPLSWLSQYVDITMPLGQLAERLTMAGLEVSGIESTTGDWKGVVVARVLEVRPHPSADRLCLATVELGEGRQKTVVCGACNVAPGQKVAFAAEGAELIDGKKGLPTTLRATVIRGVESSGMILSERELGLSDNHEGILVLDDRMPIGDPLASHLGETILNLDLKPNRPDTFSVLGVAREVAALTGCKVREPDLDYGEAGPAAKSMVQVDIVDPLLCPRYCAAVIEGVKVAPSPSWIQERLVSAGIRPINNVVDVTNYVMIELGQPLHAFDLSKLRGGRVMVRAGRSGESLRLLDGTERELGEGMLVIADAERPVAVAGVMGGVETEVNPQTGTILIESANFDAVSIRGAASALKIRTEASLRFEKGLSRSLPLIAARRAARLIKEACGGRVARGIVDVFPGRQRDIRITITSKRISQVLGIELPTVEVRRILVSLGFTYRRVSPDTYVVRVPYWRTDVHIPEDIVEELARIHGYNRLPSSGLRGTLPTVHHRSLLHVRERVRNELSGLMQEIVSYPLTSGEALSRVSSPQALATRPPVRMLNPISTEYGLLRTNLRVSILENLRHNLRYRRRLAVFEMGRTFQSRLDNLPEEREIVCGAVSGPRLDRWGQPRGEPADFYDAKAYLERVFASLGLVGEYEEVEEFGFVTGRTAAVFVDGERVGLVGQIHPNTAIQFRIEQDVSLFELDIDRLVVQELQIIRPRAVPRFPSVERDIAVVVDDAVASAQVKGIIESSKLVARASLFDVYTRSPVPLGRKSLAFAVSYQSLDHTLTDAEVVQEHDRIVERIKREVGADLR